MATVCNRGGRAYGSSNWTALLHRRFLLEWGDNVYLACVHFTGISWSPAGDRVTAPRRYRLSLGRIKWLFVTELSTSAASLR